jgi:polar amino acid transport system substrate-binding protein
MKKVFIAISSLVLFSLFMAACAPTPTPSAPVTVVVTQLVAQPPVASPTVVPPTAAPTPVASVDPSTLSQKGKLLVCSDIPYAPFESFDDNGNAVGLDVDLAQGIADRLGLKLEVVNSQFDTIIEAVSGGKCDIIMSDMNITGDRNKQISFIHYLQVGQSILVAKGNPSNINAPTDLCGQNVAAESGTTEVDYLQGGGDYKGKGLAAACAAAGKQPVNVVTTSKDSDALQQLQAGKVVAYFADTPVAGQYVAQHPDQFQLVGQPIEPLPVGIGVPCGGASDCTSAPLTPLGQAIQTALKSMMADGTYLNILSKYGSKDAAVTLP